MSSEVEDVKKFRGRMFCRRAVKSCVLRVCGTIMGR